MLVGKHESPFSEEEWKRIEEAVLSTAKRNLTARRLLDVVGPTGVGHQTTWVEHVPYEGEGCLVVGEGAGHTCKPVVASSRTFLPVPLIHSDFVLYWRDVETSRQLGTPLELSVAHSSARRVALAEDRMVFWGDEKNGIKGILTVEGALRRKMRNWNTTGNAFADVVSAISELSRRGFTSSLYVVLSPADWAKLSRLYGNTGVLEIEQIKKLVDDVVVSPVIDEGTAVVLSATPETMDLFVALDITLAFVETRDMNAVLRVMEAVVPRIKVPEAIVVMTKGG